MLPNVLHFLTTFLTVQPTLVAANPVPNPPEYWTRPPPGHLGAVASEAKICTQVGIDLLKKGGNAADAMVGSVFCVGVVGMYHSGLGGGGFMLVRGTNGSYEFIDFRETAPAAAFEDMYKNNVNASIYGGLASGVPGEVRGLEYLHKHYGQLPWRRVLAPAIRIARHGFPVTEDLVSYMKSATSNYADNFLVNDPQFAIDFAPNSKLLTVNQTLTRKRYAATLQQIAIHGADAFYEGPIAEATIRALKSQNGTMTLADLKNYTVAIRKPSSITYKGFRITGCSAPSGGNVALNVLKVMEGYEGVGREDMVNLTTHRLDEAMRFAYGARSNLGDPLFVQGLDKYQNDMLSDTAAAEIRSKISDNRTFDVSYYDPKGLESLETPGTSHVVTADYTGMSVSLTTTVNLLFGNRLVVPETGVIMNNEMNDFSIPNTTNAFGYIPSAANFIRPGKRPLSSITPLIITHLNTTLYATIGAAGGSRIITSTIQNALHLLSYNRSIADALAQPRLHDQLVPAAVSFEYGYDNSTVAFLKQLGSNVTYVAPGQSSAQGLVRRWDGGFEAAGEPRQRNSGGLVV